MTHVGLVASDEGTRAVMKAVLERAGCRVTSIFAPPRRVESALDALRSRGADILVLAAPDPGEVPGVLPLTTEPPIESWLFPGGQIPAAYVRSVHGVEQARNADIASFAELSTDLRRILRDAAPTWSSDVLASGPGRPPGIRVYHATGYAVALELLMRGDGAELRPKDIAHAVGRSVTPINRYVRELVKRGYLTRASARSPLLIQGCDRLSDDMARAIAARYAENTVPQLPIGSSLPTNRLLTRLAKAAERYALPCAVTGAAAARAHGFDLVEEGMVMVFLPPARWRTLTGEVGAETDRHNPRIILTAPYEEGVFHAAEKGDLISVVSPWQASLDLLASTSERNREAGATMRRALLGRSR